MTQADEALVIGMAQSLLTGIDKPAILISEDYRILAANQHYLAVYQTPLTLGESHCYTVSHGFSSPCDQHGETCPLLAVREGKEAHRTVHIHETGTGHAYCNIAMTPVMRPTTKPTGERIGYLEVLEHLEYASDQPKPGKLIGRSQNFRKVLSLISRCAPTDVSTLVLGESGCGKELVAKAIHQQSKRAGNPLVNVECTGLSEQLFESEVFGHEKGAFTGASSAKKGLVEEADEGTLFLDEIGDVPLNLQVKLLRLLETGIYRRVGSVTPRQGNFRLICATHENLPQMVARGDFRSDLYYRLAIFSIRIPPLRKRIEDIPVLIDYFLAQSEGIASSISKEAREILCQYNYPGNIRELKNVIQHASIMCDGNTITCEDLPQELLAGIISNQSPLTTSYDSSGDSATPELRSLADHEKSYLRQVMNTSDLPMEQLAKELGVSVRTLYRKIKSING